MIDIQIEEVLSLTEAARRLPRRRKGKRPHPSTLFRWASNGLRGVRLETLRVGGTTYTTMEALQRFFEGLSPDGDAPAPSPPRQPDDGDTDRQLDAIGL